MNFYKKLSNQTVTIVLIGLLSGCSCDKVPEIEDEITRKKDNIEILDTVVDSEIIPTTSSLEESLDLDNAQPTADFDSTSPQHEAPKKRVRHKSIPHDTYDEDSYTDLEMMEYDSGLRTQILREGPSDAEMPKRGQIVTTHYVCWHDNNGKPGTPVDNTYERGEPFEFKIGYGYAIRGWDEGIMDMRIGDKRRLYIPSEMAFGQAGATELVPGDTDLLYEVELVGIRDDDTPKKRIGR